jgi:hydroxypyruvate isomerase
MSSSRRTFLRTSVGAIAAASLPGGLAANALVPGVDPAANAAGASPNANGEAVQDPANDLAALHAASKTSFALNLEMWLGGKPLEDRIREASALGYKFFEFWPWRGKNIEAVQLAIEETGMKPTQFTAWGFNPGMNDPKNHSKFVKEVEASCKTAKAIGAPMMTIVGGNDQAGMSQKQMHNNIITGLKLAAPIAEEFGVMMILESMNIRRDHPGHCLYGSPDAVRICQEVDSPMVKINLDLYHMQISEGDLCGHLHEGWDQIGYLQLADHPGRQEPGTGEINYARVLREAWDLGYRKPVGVECSPSESAEASTRRLLKACTW